MPSYRHLPIPSEVSCHCTRSILLLLSFHISSSIFLHCSTFSPLLPPNSSTSSSASAPHTPYLSPPLEFFFQEQSYSSLHSEWNLARDHVRGDIDDPCGANPDFCGVIADFCGVIADPCGVVAIPEAIGGPAGADRCATR